MCILGDKRNPLNNNLDCDTEYRGNFKFIFHLILCKNKYKFLIQGFMFQIALTVGSSVEENHYEMVTVELTEGMLLFNFFSMYILINYIF